MKVLKEMLRGNNFLARSVSYGMIVFCFRISISIGLWWTEVDSLKDVKLFGITGILLGTLIGHLLYYYWIFPEKRNLNRSALNID